MINVILRNIRRHEWCLYLHRGFIILISNNILRRLMSNTLYLIIEKTRSSWTNLIFSLFWTWFLQASKASKNQVRNRQKSSSSNMIFEKSFKLVLKIKYRWIGRICIPHGARFNVHGPSGWLLLFPKTIFDPLICSNCIKKVFSRQLWIPSQRPGTKRFPIALQEYVEVGLLIATIRWFPERYLLYKDSESSWFIINSKFDIFSM